MKGAMTPDDAGGRTGMDGFEVVEVRHGPWPARNVEDENEGYDRQIKARFNGSPAKL